ncbi:hypothetical protein HA402_007496 [Bradysia odoriphaga]|nr:hypothetical protein HA402_007496 [Bradysia odoriphaga]
MARFGVRNAMQNPEVFRRNRQAMFKQKLFVWPSGKRSLYMGNEHFLYKLLLTTMKEEDIDVCGNITFPYLNVSHDLAVYFPDAIVGNVVYEVKSWFTLDADKNIRLKMATSRCCTFSKKRMYFSNTYSVRITFF